jgi:hypothetical protein
MARRLIEFRGFVGWAFPTISIIGGSASGLREEVLARFSNSFLVGGNRGTATNSEVVKSHVAHALLGVSLEPQPEAGGAQSEGVP